MPKGKSAKRGRKNKSSKNAKPSFGLFGNAQSEYGQRRRKLDDAIEEAETGRKRDNQSTDRMN